MCGGRGTCGPGWTNSYCPTHHTTWNCHRRWSLPPSLPPSLSLSLPLSLSLSLTHTLTHSHSPTLTHSHSAVDYGPVEQRYLSFFPSTRPTTQCMTIPINDDFTVEQDETFNVNLQILSDFGTVGSPVSTVTIITATVALSTSDDTATSPSESTLSG